MLLVPVIRKKKQVDLLIQGQSDLQSKFQDSQGCYIGKSCLAKTERKKKKQKAGGEGG